LPNIPINSFSFDSDAPISISLGEEYNFLSSIKYFLFIQTTFKEEK